MRKPYVSLQGESGAHGAAGSPGLAVSVPRSCCVKPQTARELLLRTPEESYWLTAVWFFLAHFLCTCRELAVAPEREVALVLLDLLVLVVLMAILDPLALLSVFGPIVFQLLLSGGKTTLG